jgi:precorrin-2/cobalt-factor-2 C20-methyltransferase
MSGFSSSNGRLFGVGLGPGDPDLVTIKATKIISAVPVAAYFAKKGGRGKARAVLDRWVGDTCLQLPLLYPLTTETHFCDPAYTQELRAFYTMAEGAVATHLLAGRDVALVCEGDPLFYGSFMHLYVLLKDRFNVEIVPGVTGMSGCWSAGTLGPAALVRHLGASDAVVIIKIGANLAKIRAAITKAGRLAAAIYVEHGTSETEMIVPLAGKTDDHAPYFSSILIPGQGRRP